MVQVDATNAIESETPGSTARVTATAYLVKKMHIIRTKGLQLPGTVNSFDSGEYATLRGGAITWPDATTTSKAHVHDTRAGR